jgi:3-methyladenine DNA glycosylase/8-oxoguanine DNA glycosylase
MAAFARDTFGEYGGIAQQYLFYYMRENSRDP